MSDHIVKFIGYPHTIIVAGKYEITIGNSQMRVNTARGWRLIKNGLIEALVLHVVDLTS